MRIVVEWNHLNTEVEPAETVESFKEGMTIYRKERSFRKRNIFHTKGRFYSNFSGPLVEIWHRKA